MPLRFAERAHGRRARPPRPRAQRVILLLAPPFDRSAQDPGYIQGYPPGVRENGGQYTHAAVWVVMALAELGSGDEAVELFHMVNPVNHSRDAADVARYKTEPYVLAGDVYAHPAHPGRGGWSWYTGSAAWMYRAGPREHPRPAPPRRHVRHRPMHPVVWPEYAIAWRFGGTRYEIAVSNPDHRCRGVASADLDGEPVDPSAIPLVDDGGVHRVQVALGSAKRRKPAERSASFPARSG